MLSVSCARQDAIGAQTLNASAGPARGKQGHLAGPPFPSRYRCLQRVHLRRLRSTLRRAWRLRLVAAARGQPHPPVNRAPSPITPAAFAATFTTRCYGVSRVAGRWPNSGRRPAGRDWMTWPTRTRPDSRRRTSWGYWMARPAWTWPDSGRRTAGTDRMGRISGTRPDAGWSAPWHRPTTDANIAEKQDTLKRHRNCGHEFSPRLTANGPGWRG
jgi:hypothetical protein